MCGILKDVHSVGLTHRDISSDNICIHVLKLSDFDPIDIDDDSKVPNFVDQL